MTRLDSFGDRKELQQLSNSRYANQNATNHILHMLVPKPPFDTHTHTQVSRFYHPKQGTSFFWNSGWLPGYPIKINNTTNKVTAWPTWPLPHHPVENRGAAGRMCFYFLLAKGAGKGRKVRPRTALRWVIFVKPKWLQQIRFFGKVTWYVYLDPPQGCQISVWCLRSGQKNTKNTFWNSTAYFL